MDFIPAANSDEAKHKVAERFVGWLEQRILKEARGDEDSNLAVAPTGRYWLGRLGPKRFVTLQDERGDRLEPCAIGIRLRPQKDGPWSFSVDVRFCLWIRRKSDDSSALRWAFDKSPLIEATIPIKVSDQIGTYIFGEEILANELQKHNAAGLSAHISVKIIGREREKRIIEISLVNDSDELAEFSDGRFFETAICVHKMPHTPFLLESLPDSFRYNRNVHAYGINCGAVIKDDSISTCDALAATKFRPIFWPPSYKKPDISFSHLSTDPCSSASELISSIKKWAAEAWSLSSLEQRSQKENWSSEMYSEAITSRKEFNVELERIDAGVKLLISNEKLRSAFQLMNKAMEISAQGKYTEWRPFQFAFLLANLECLINKTEESKIVDIVWFATGGGKTETYLGLILTAAFLDRMQGKISGITAWSRFPLRMLSLQQTQRFSNALAAAELVKRNEKISGDAFSLGFLVGGTSTPNRIKKESDRAIEDLESIEGEINPFKLLQKCPFCHSSDVTSGFDRVLWRLNHYCGNKDCPNGRNPLPIYVVDDEIWRFLPTIVIGTLDKAANIARSPGMRGLLGNPRGICSRPGHGYTYAPRRDFPHGCLVPDCTGAVAQLPMTAELYPPTFRLQDELHLLRDSLGAVDAHYESALDSLQEEISGHKPKILASSATLSGYAKQVSVLYQRQARVFPQPPPVEGSGFWALDSDRLMRRFVALAPRRLTVEFVVDRLIISLQKNVRQLISNPQSICSDINVDCSHADFLINLYGTNVIYGNTLQDIDAVIRSSETQYAEISPPPNIATLTGRTGLKDVRETLERLENPEDRFEDRLHLIAASSMMSHGVDIDRLNVMIMLAFPLGVADFIQATARVGRRWPALVVVVPKINRERDASLYRCFPQFITHGDRFVEPIPITRKSRRVLTRTISGLEMSRILMIHEPTSAEALTTIKSLNNFVKNNKNALIDDEAKLASILADGPEGDLMRQQIELWFKGFSRNLTEPPSDTVFVSQLSPTGEAMTSLRDVEEQAPVKGDSSI